MSFVSKVMIDLMFLKQKKEMNFNIEKTNLMIKELERQAKIKSKKLFKNRKFNFNSRYGPHVSKTENMPDLPEIPELGLYHPNYNAIDKNQTNTFISPIKPEKEPEPEDPLEGLCSRKLKQYKEEENLKMQELKEEEAREAAERAAKEAAEKAANDAEAQAAKAAKDAEAYIANFKDIVYFETAKADPLEMNIHGPIWDALKIFMDKFGDVTVVVAGHTDSDGRASTNQALSERRANAVKAILVEKGIDAKRIKTVYKGENEPIATNDTDEGKAKNRRVEITLAK